MIIICTAVTFDRACHYFGRNLDLEFRYDEKVTVTPRNYPLQFTNKDTMNYHYALIGMATVVKDYPLYYDATNEHGLSMAGLNFPGNAVYVEPVDGKCNVASFELIPYILGKCRCVEEAEALLSDLRIVNIPFSQDIPPSPLHWIVSDSNGSVTVEPTSEGTMVYPNPVGVLTNNPPFPYHMYNLCNYLNVTRDEAQNRFSNELTLEAFSRGMGGIGLPGDLSSQSRFVRAAFTKWNAVCGNTEAECVSQFFHILDSIVQQRGCVRLGSEYEITLYQSCCNTDNGIYYYKTYENSQITAVDMHKTDLNASLLSTYPLRETQNILYENT